MYCNLVGPTPSLEEYLDDEQPDEQDETDQSNLQVVHPSPRRLNFSRISLHPCQSVRVMSLPIMT